MPARSIRRLGALLAVSLGATAVAATAAVAAPGTGPAPGGPPTNHQGTLPDGASWTMDVPAHWNGTLLLFSHGLVTPATRTRPSMPPIPSPPAAS